MFSELRRSLVNVPRRVPTLLLLGLLTTAAVTAYTLRPNALGPGLRTTGVEISDSEFWKVSQQQRFGRSYIAITRTTGKLVPRGKRGFVSESSGGAMSAALYQAKDPAPPFTPPTDAVQISRITAGWPFDTLRAEQLVYDPATGKQSVKPSIYVVPRPPPGPDGVTRGRNDYDREIPTMPYVPGAAGNIVVFAVAWWPLLIGLGLARGWHRRRRGLCPQCAYDLVGKLDEGCPECGWGRTAAVSR
jgi:hypothetical protein